MAQQQNEMMQYEVPKLPSLQDVIGQGQPQANTGNIFKLLQTEQGRATDILPTIKNLLMGQTGPAVQNLRQGAQSAAASAQSEAMKRGLTGSDIESANMTSALMQGEQQVGQLLAQQASTLAQYIMNAYGMDVQSNREMFVTLAQALGQELQSQRDIEQARLDREAMVAEGARQRQSSLLGSLIGAGGSIAGGFARSDERLKENIQMLAFVNGVTIHRWKWNDKAKEIGCDKEPNIGVIAQEVEKIIPDIVSMKDGYKAVNYAKLPKEVKIKIAELRG